MINETKPTILVQIENKVKSKPSKEKYFYDESAGRFKNYLLILIQGHMVLNFYVKIFNQFGQDKKLTFMSLLKTKSFLIQVNVLLFGLILLDDFLVFPLFKNKEILSYQSLITNYYRDIIKRPF